MNYEVKSGAPSGCSAASAPNPPSSGGNQPPTAVADNFSLPCNTGGSVNLTQNDTDPEGNLPLTLRSITRASGTAEARVTSASNVFVDAYGKGTSSFTYVVADSLGATASGTLQVTSTGTALACSGGAK